MCSMCHHCRADPAKSKMDAAKQANENDANLSNGGSLWSCKVCLEKLGGQPVNQDVTSPYRKPMTSPTTSLSSSDCSYSSCSKYLSALKTLLLLWFHVILI